MKHLFLVNPTAGPYDRSHELAVKLSDQLDGLGLDWEIQVTQYPGHGAALARAAAGSGQEVRIYASPSTGYRLGDIYVTYTDADGDGICDNCPAAQTTTSSRGQGNAWHHTEHAGHGHQTGHHWGGHHGC